MPVEHNDDNWKKAVDMLTGYILPERSTVFDNLKGNDDIPLMQVWIEHNDDWYYDFGKHMRGGGWNGKEYKIPFYEERGGKYPKPAKAWIDILGYRGMVPGGDYHIVDSPDGRYDVRAGNEYVDRDGKYNNVALNAYVWGSYKALSKLADPPYSTLGFEAHGTKVGDDAYVDLRSFAEVSMAFDRTVRFFEWAAGTTNEWDAKDIGEGSDKWAGTAAGMFKELIHKLARNYEGYRDQIGGEEGWLPVSSLEGHVVGYKPGRALNDVAYIVQREAVNLLNAWYEWKPMSSPQRWLHDMIMDIHMSIWPNQYDQTDFEFDQNDDIRLVMKPGFWPYVEIDGRQLGRLEHMTTWKEIGQIAVDRWQQAAQDFLSTAGAEAVIAIRDAIHGATKSFDMNIRDRDTRSISDIAAKEESKKEKLDLKKEREEAKKEAEKERAEAKAEQERAKEEARKEREEAKKEAEKEKAEARQYQEEQRQQATAAAAQARADAEKERQRQRKEQEETRAQAEKDRDAARAQAERDRAEARKEQQEAREKAKKEQEETRAQAEKDRDEVRRQQQEAMEEARADREEAKKEAEQKEAEARKEYEKEKAEAEKQREEAREQAEKERAEAKKEYERQLADGRTGQEEAREQYERRLDEINAAERDAVEKADADQREAREEYEEAKRDALADRDAQLQEAEQKEAEAREQYEKEKAEARQEREEAREQAEKERAEAKKEYERQLADGRTGQEEAREQYERRLDEINAAEREAIEKADAAEREARQEYEEAREEAKEDREQARRDARHTVSDLEGRREQMDQELRQRLAELPQRFDPSAITGGAPDYSHYQAAFDDNLYHQDDLSSALGRDLSGAGAGGAGNGSGMPMGPMMPPMMPPMGGMGGGGGGSNNERARNVLDTGITRPSRTNVPSYADSEEHRVSVRPTQTSSEMPFMSPMNGGVGGGGDRPSTQSGDRERTTWLAEDEDIWGTDEGGAPQALGRE